MTAAGVIAVRDLSIAYGRRLVFRDVSFIVVAGRSIGVVGPNGAGKTTLLRALVGFVTPQSGDVRIDGLAPRDALARTGVAYFAGDATLPGFARTAAWGSLGTGESVMPDRRPIRALSRGTRQMLGLRTVLSRHPVHALILDEPWEGLDPDAARWLSAIIESKRDRGAAVVLSSHRLHDLAGLCDEYLFLVSQRATVVKAHDIAPVGPVTPALLTDVFDRLRGGSAPWSRPGVTIVPPEDG